MSNCRRSSHDLKRGIFKNNYTKLRDGFKSNGSHIKAFLYSRSVISADVRDSNDVEKILSVVETQLKFSEETWDTLMLGMCEEPPLDVLSSDLQREFQSELASISELNKKPYTEPLLHSPPHLSHRPYTSYSVPKSLPISESLEKMPTASKRDSGCGSTTLLEYNYPENYFPPSDILHQQHNGTKRSPSNASSNDSGLDPEPKSPNNTSMTNPLPATTSAQSHSPNSELVRPVSISEHYDGTVNSFSLHRKIADLKMENTNLHYTKKQMVNQLQELEEEREYLLEIRKDDQKLLEVKMQQVAQDNEILEKKQEFIRKIEMENTKLKKDLKAVTFESEEMAIRNQELICRLSLAERNTTLSAITIDRLKQDIANRDNLIEELRGDLSHWKDWYEAVHRSEESNETYIPFSGPETR